MKWSRLCGKTDSQKVLGRRRGEGIFERGYRVKTLHLLLESFFDIQPLGINSPILNAGASAGVFPCASARAGGTSELGQGFRVGVDADRGPIGGSTPVAFRGPARGEGLRGQVQRFSVWLVNGKDLGTVNVPEKNQKCGTYPAFPLNSGIIIAG